MKSRLVSIVGITLVLLLSLTACNLLPPITFPGITPAPTQTTAPSVSPIEPGWTPSSGERAQALPSIADVVAKAKPSVVAINTKLLDYDIFNRPIQSEGAGSGWIIDKNGIIVTNNHVVEGANSITVTLSDGRDFTADLGRVATDPLTDLAIIKIDAQDLPAATIGDSAGLRVGDWVVALGNSLGMGISATKGIVSAQGIQLELSAGQTLYDLIQTDAAINPGNSGGPLLDLSGEVVGINSAKVAQVGVEGMGYAISMKEALPIIQQLINQGSVTRAWLGVTLRTVDQSIASQYSLSVDKGALVVNIARGSPADNAGIKAGDVIVKYGDVIVNTLDDLIKAIRVTQIGQSVEIAYYRDTTLVTTSVTLVKSP